MPIHLATSSNIGRAVRRALRVPVHFAPDNLLLGPCAADPDVHNEARVRYWDLNRGERARFRASCRALMEALASRSHLVLWTSRLWSDVVALWARCAWRLELRPLDPKIDLVVLGSPSDNAFGRGYIPVKGADVRRGLESVRPLSLTRVREMALFWRKLTSPSPILASAGRRGGREREDLLTIGAYQAAFFPRLHASRLDLSRFDNLLFSCIGDQWSSSVDVLVRKSAAGKELWKWSNHIGDVIFATRLQAWAAHNGDRAALDSKPYRPERPMLEYQYKLSAVGEKILRDGLDDVAQGVPLPVGGAVAYDPLAPWVVVADSADRESLRRMS
jgi:hypothetical protein